MDPISPPGASASNKGGREYSEVMPKPLLEM